MGLFSWKNQFPVEGKTVVITGGSQGLGLALGKLLAQKGANVVLVARNVEKLQAAVECISAAAKDPKTQRFHYISADVTSVSENIRLLQETTTWNNGQSPDVVWANAGTSYPALFIDTPVEILRSQMEINYWSSAYLAHETFKLWLKPNTTNSTTSPSSSSSSSIPSTKHFVITSSSTAYCGVAGYAIYGPSKAALRSLADSLQSELLLYTGARQSASASIRATVPAYDVKIHTITPGSIETPGFEHENLTKHPVTYELEKSDPVQTADEVAHISMRGLEKGWFLISTNWLAKLMRVSSMGGSPRDGLVWDTLGQIVTAFAWIFIKPDLDSTVLNYGKKHGIYPAEEEKGKSNAGTGSGH